MRPRTALALGLAGLATAGLGVTAGDAAAAVRTFELTLANGKSLTVSVDVAPGTDLWDIAFPGVAKDQITAIAEVPTPAPVQTTPQAPAPTQTTPGSTSTTPTTPAPATTTPTTPAEPSPESAPKPKSKGKQQKTTGKAKRADDDEAEAKTDAEAGDDAAERDGAEEERQSDETPAGGVPSILDPSTSIATPGAAAVGVPNFFIDKFKVPPFLLSIYQAAGMEYGVRWEVLAAINEIETDYGRNLNVSSAGALGWMQFMPATWKAYGVDANGDDKKDPYNPVDAIFAAARYLKASGADTDLRGAIFSYNHADWYVDSVLMRARLLGGLPSNLVGSLTGLTQGIFPVAAKATYKDEVSERDAETKVEAGDNAAVPVESEDGRRGITIHSRAGAAAVAVQDGKVVKIGETERLGKFVQIRDAYGNTYTYAHLKKVAATHPVPKELTKAQKAKLAKAAKEAAAEPAKDPKPTLAASAGKQPKKAAAAAPAKERAAANAPAPTAEVFPEVAKERLFAAPARPESFKAGGRVQLESEVTESAVNLLGIPADQVEMKKLKVGSRVIGGTVLGRLGVTQHGRSPHLLFEIRPSGRGAPRIDPKPILDGWKLLESTAIYRAKGRNPFFGREAQAPSIGQILLMGKSDLQERVLANPRIEIYGAGRTDVQSGRIDRRVLATLEYLAASGLRPTVSSLQTGHGFLTASGNVSHHSSGNAVDIAAVNGIPITGHQGKNSITDVTIQRLLTLQGTMKPAQIISLMKYENADNTMAMGDHDDHIHVGFTPYADTNSKSVRGLTTMLKPSQWSKLMERLGDIENPVVATKPSKDAITVLPPKKGTRASHAHDGE
ncbi:MAG TPA: lytic murein transglycosylase [Solirubrobacteraceae bacterium]|nr:lytic murein transglycosylase [Solirubrobacteraceae bacterium]